jgi:RNA polymerase-binding transcription factor DksA
VDSVLHGDEADIAAEVEEMERSLALQRLRASYGFEEPDEDEQGNRYCLDCGERIPAARVLAVQAVRCVDCASVRERGSVGSRISRTGILRYLGSKK